MPDDGDKRLDELLERIRRLPPEDRLRVMTEELLNASEGLVWSIDEDARLLGLEAVDTAGTVQTHSFALEAWPPMTLAQSRQVVESADAWLAQVKGRGQGGCSETRQDRLADAVVDRALDSAREAAPGERRAVFLLSMLDGMGVEWTLNSDESALHVRYADGFGGVCEEDIRLPNWPPVSLAEAFALLKAATAKMAIRA